jgi:hypothetical protein
VICGASPSAAHFSARFSSQPPAPAPASTDLLSRRLRK